MAETEVEQQLRELLATAQTALEDGRHQETIATCRYVLQHFPDAVTALRLLGEAHLEDGRASEAAQCFDRVLNFDPYNVLARVGLAVIAEDRGEDDRALAQFRLAWEVQPGLPQLRNELVRLYRKRYGAGGRLRLTRVALANLHARNEDLPRAIQQFRELWTEDARRPDVALGLVEALWRSGADEEATTLCRQILAERPQTARALLLMGALTTDPAEAERAFGAARGLDPDGELARGLLALRDMPALHAQAAELVSVPEYDAAAGLPDRSAAPLTTQDGSKALSWEDIAQGWISESPLVDDAEPVGLVGAADDEVDELFATIDRQLAAGEPAGNDPSSEAPEDVLPAWDAAAEDEFAPRTGELTAVERLTENWDDIDDELEAARPSAESVVGVTGMLGDLGQEFDITPFDIDSASTAAEAAAPVFDPNKFELPPLDDDDNLRALGIDADELGADVAPFSLEDGSGGSKTSGMSFTDLVDTGDLVLSTPPPAQQAAAPADPEVEGAPDVASAASIFATRDLASLDAEQQRDLQALVSPALAAVDPVAESAADSFTALLDEVSLQPASTELLPEPAPGTNDDDVVVAALPAPAAAEPADVDVQTDLLVATTNSEAPPADSDDLSPAMDQLFNRLRHRKLERIQTGDLTVNRQLPPNKPLSPPAGAQPAANTDSLITFTPGAAMETGVLSFDEWQARQSGPGTVSDTAPAAELPEWAPAMSAEDETSDRQSAASGASQVADADDPVANRPSDAAWSSAAHPAAEAGSDSADAALAEAPVWETLDNPAPHYAPFTRQERAAAVASWPFIAAVPEQAPDETWHPAGNRFHDEDSAREPELPEPQAPHGEAAPVAPAVSTPARVHRQSQTEQIAALESMVAADPGNPFARLTLAVAYGSDRPDQALTEYRRLIKEADEVVPEVIERLQEMIADNAGGPRAHRVLGDAYMKLGQFDLAMAEFQRALATRAKK
jgi:thioredoxin-like negative regulator of GroEL